MRTNLLLLTLGLTACQPVVGSGNVVTDTREVPAFRQLAVASGIRATVGTGTRALSLSADDNLHRYVETFVEEDTLVVRVKPSTMVGPGRTLDVTITNDLLEGLQASGGSRVTVAATPTERFPITASGGSVVQVTGLSSTSFAIDASGGSEVTVAGAATSAVVEASGGSDLLLKGVPLEALRVTASGGATVVARVSQALTGSASGGSTITIVGTPESTVATSGGSQVRLGAVP